MNDTEFEPYNEENIRKYFNVPNEYEILDNLETARDAESGDSNWTVVVNNGVFLGHEKKINKKIAIEMFPLLSRSKNWKDICSMAIGEEGMTLVYSSLGTFSIYKKEDEERKIKNLMFENKMNEWSFGIF